MRGWFAALVLIAACKGKAASTKVTLAVPTVQDPTVVATDASAPPVVLFVDDTDDVRIAAAATWADFDAHKLRVAKRSGPLDLLHRYVFDNCSSGKPPLRAVKSWDEDTRKSVDVRALEAKLYDEDPPPPEEDEDDSDEVGSPGMAISLEEGKMGKKDSDRAEGQYKLSKADSDPKIARQRAVERARTDGVLSRIGGPDVFFPMGGGHLNADGTPSRVTQVEGTVMPDGLNKLCTLIVIAPTARATRLIDVLDRTDGAIAVSHNGKVRPLNVQFQSDVYDSGFGMHSYGYLTSPDHWLEVRVSANTLVVEAVPDKPIDVAKPEELAEALAKASDAKDSDADGILDVLVDADVDVQRLLDVIVALDAAGAGTIGLGPMPSSDELARRGRRIPTVRFGQPNAQGDLDKKDIRKVMKANRRPITACYERAVITNPTLSGTVMAQFFITPEGTVAMATASGLDAAVSFCVADVIKTMIFPKPKGGGGVQVNYPFMFRP